MDKSLVLRPKTVCLELGISLATFWRLVKADKLQTIKLSARCTGVRRSVLDAYLNQV